MHLPQPKIARHDFLESREEEPRENVLVTVFLRGGADGLTLVPPVADDAYHAARATLAISPSAAIDLSGYFGLNRSLAPLKRFYDAGEMLIVHGAGSEDNTRSHFEAQDTMEHAGAAGSSGWLGRFMRAREPAPSALSAVAIGTTRPESLRGAPAGAVMQSIRDFSLGAADSGFVDSLAALYANSQGALSSAGRDTIEAVRRLRTIRAEDPAPMRGATYPDTNFGRGLREIARLIHADVGLASSTIDLGGWDTHFVQAQLIDRLMENLSQGLDAFMADIADHRQRVTLVVMTEFGRRLRENTSFGTDHGAGGVMMTFGAGVQPAGPEEALQTGWPDLSESNLDDVGDVPAVINYRDVLSPILARHTPGIDLDAVFPGHRVQRTFAALRG